MKWQKLVNTTILGGFLLGGALVLPASAQTTGVLQDQVPGSFLVFPIFDISSGNTTQIRICDKSNGAKGDVSTWVRVNFICPGTVSGSNSDPGSFCDEFDTDFSLTAHQCKVVNVADLRPPCSEGFVVAFAESRLFQPWAHDHLIGSYHITSAAGTEAANAISIQSPQPFHTPLGHIGSLGSTEFLFADVLAPLGVVPLPGLPPAGGPDYVGLPALLHIDFKAVVRGADTRLTLLTLNINSGARNNETSVKLAWWDQQERPYSASHQFVCWDRVSLASIDPHFTQPGLTTDYGSLKVTPSATFCDFPGGQCPVGGSYRPAVLGALEETGPGTTLRHLFHTGSAALSQHYGPE